MNETELTAWLNLMAELGFIRPWFWVTFGSEQGQRGCVCYLINGRTYSYKHAVQFVRDCEALDQGCVHGSARHAPIGSVAALLSKSAERL
jgi:hypothetical protein